MQLWGWGFKGHEGLNSKGGPRCLLMDFQGMLVPQVMLVPQGSLNCLSIVMCLPCLHLSALH